MQREKLKCDAVVVEVSGWSQKGGGGGGGAELYTLLPSTATSHWTVP